MGVAFRFSILIVVMVLGACRGDGERLPTCADCPEFVAIPVGEAVLELEIAIGAEAGSFSGRRIFRLTDPLYVSKYEVTRANWAACEDAGACSSGANLAPIGPTSRFFNAGRARQPVTSIRFDQIVAYLEWLSEETEFYCRLPTEFEWEYLARAGAEDEFHFGPRASFRDANFDALDPCWPRTDGEVCRADPRWRQSDYRNWLRPVGSYAPNDWGLFDVHGNAAELTSTCAVARQVSRGGGNGLDGCDHLIERGGSFLSPARDARLSYRIARPKDNLARVWLGFRPVCQSRDSR